MFVPSRFLRIAHVRAARAKRAHSAHIPRRKRPAIQKPSAPCKTPAFFRSPRRPERRPFKDRISAGCRHPPKNAARAQRTGIPKISTRPAYPLSKAATPSQISGAPKERKRLTPRQKRAKCRSPRRFKSRRQRRKLKADGGIEKRRIRK